jgi:hypothetical protein
LRIERANSSTSWRASTKSSARIRDRRRLEVEEQPLERVAQLLFDHALGLLERERSHVVLQPPQLDHDVGRYDVGSRREELPELHERRPELVEHLTQMLAARGRGGALVGRHVGEALLRRAARQEVAQLVRLEEVAEAVANHDLRDLRQASDAAGRAHDRKATRRVCRWLGRRWEVARALEQPHPVLELGDAELELVELVAGHEVELLGDRAQRREGGLREPLTAAAHPAR